MRQAPIRRAAIAAGGFEIELLVKRATRRCIPIDIRSRHEFLFPDRSYAGWLQQRRSRQAPQVQQFPLLRPHLRDRIKSEKLPSVVPIDILEGLPLELGRIERVDNPHIADAVLLVECLARNDVRQLGRRELNVEGGQPAVSIGRHVWLSPCWRPADHVLDFHIREDWAGRQHPRELIFEAMVLLALLGTTVAPAVYLAGILAAGAPFAIAGSPGMVSEVGATPVPLESYTGIFQREVNGSFVLRASETSIVRHVARMDVASELDEERNADAIEDRRGRSKAHLRRRRIRVFDHLNATCDFIAASPAPRCFLRGKVRLVPLHVSTHSAVGLAFGRWSLRPSSIPPRFLELSSIRAPIAIRKLHSKLLSCRPACYGSMTRGKRTGLARRNRGGEDYGISISGHRKIEQDRRVPTTGGGHSGNRRISMTTLDFFPTAGDVADNMAILAIDDYQRFCIEEHHDYTIRVL